MNDPSNPKSTPKDGAAEERALARIELTRALAQARTARQRLDLMLSSPRAGELVPTLPAEELFFTIKEVGLADSVELVHLASASQFRTFVDLDAWKRDRMEVSDVLYWLRAARTDDDDARYLKKLSGMDMEVIELLLKSSLKIWDLEEDPDPELHGPFFRSPEGRYVVEFETEGAEYAALKRLLDDLYGEDAFRAARLLEAVRWGLSSDLEETAYRWRNARLADLGFPEPSEALSYFAYVDPAATLPKLEKVPHVPAGFFLSRREPSGRFFDEVSRHIAPEERDAVERQLATVMNAVMVVEETDVGEPDQVARALGLARDTLSLGLQKVSGGDAVFAASLLTSAPLKRVFQVGVSLALKLKFRADRIMSSGRASFPASRQTPLFDDPLGDVVVALRRRRPQYSQLLDPANAGGTRPFRELADIDRVARELDQAERLAEVMARVGFEPKAAAEALAATHPPEVVSLLHFSDLYLTAVVRGLTGDGFAFAPLAPRRLSELARTLRTEGGAPALSDEFVEALHRPLEGAASSLSAEHLAAAKGFAALCEQRWLAEVGKPYALSGRFSSGKALPLVVAGA